MLAGNDICNFVIVMSRLVVNGVNVYFAFKNVCELSLNGL